MVCLVRDFVSAELVVWWFVALLTNSCFPAREGGQTDSSKVLASPRSVTKLPLHAAFVSVHAQVVPASSSEQILWFWLFCCVSGQWACIWAFCDCAETPLSLLCMHRDNGFLQGWKKSRVVFDSREVATGIQEPGFPCIGRSCAIGCLLPVHAHSSCVVSKLQLVGDFVVIRALGRAPWHPALLIKGGASLLKICSSDSSASFSGLADY